MKLITKPATTKNPPEQFTGDVWVDPIVSPQDEDQRATLARVRFAPGARTAWHSHARGQTLYITSGVALVGVRGGEVLRLSPGQTVYTAPGEEHWHGATAQDFMEHLACMELGDDPSVTTTWLEHVSDDDYSRPGRP